MSELRDSLLGEKKNLNTFDKIYEDCKNRINKIKQKNDTLQKNTGTQMQDEIAKEVRKQKEFIENEINELKDQLSEMERKYRDGESKNKIKQLKVDAQKQIERNKVILKEFIQKSFLIVENVRRTRGQVGDEDQNKYFQGGRTSINEENDGRNINKSVSRDQQRQIDRSNEKKQQQKMDEIEIDYEIQQKINQQKTKLLKEVEQDTYKINQIIVDIGEMVYGQGQDLDIVTDNIVDTHKNVVHANQNITEASELQKKAKKKQICITVIIILAVLLVVGIVFILKYK